MDIREIVEKLNCQVEAVARMLLPGGKQVGREWEAGSVNGEEGRSLKVCISGSKVGVWSDFASGEKGDLLDLWRITRGLSLSEVLAEVKTYLGIEDPSFTRTKEKSFRKPSIPKSAKRVVDKSPVMAYLTGERKLTMEAINTYRVAEVDKVGPWESWKRQEAWKGPWIVFPYLRHNDLKGLKFLHLERVEGKKQTLVEPGCEPTCFGWQVINPSSRELTICEGEIDAMTLWQYGHPTVSVPFGAGKGDKQQWVDYDWCELERFETINLCMDNDKEGSVAVEELVKRLGIHRCRVVVLPRKDANKCLQDGVTKEEIDNCFASAKFIEPEELRRASDYTSAVMDEFYPAGGKLPGFDMPWGKIPFRFLHGEVSIISGCNGHGKSLCWGQVMLAGALSGEPCCIASFEMHPRKTLARIIRQSTGEKTPGRDSIEKCMEWLSDKIWIFALVGTGKVERMLQVFEYAYRRHGVRHFLIDSMMKLGLAEDDYHGQKDLIEVLCDFVNSTGVHVHLIAHPRKEDESLPVGKMAVKGTGAITDLAFNVFTIWRNKPKEVAIQEYRDTSTLPKKYKTFDDLDKEPDCILICDKSRNVDEAEGRYGLWFHPASMQYLSKKDEEPKQYFLTDDHARNPQHFQESDCPY